MSEKKLTKKENSEISSMLFNDFERFEFFFAAHWRKIAGIALLLAVVITAFFGINSYLKAQDRKAVNSLNDAKTETEIVEVLKLYGNHRVADGTRMRLAAMYAESKRYDEARQVIRPVIGNGNENFAPYARLLDAYYDEAAGKLADAAQKFEAIQNDAANPAQVRLEGAYAAGRLYVELKNFDKAKESLRKATTAGNPAANQWHMLAQSMLNLIDGNEFGPAAKK